MTEFEIASLMLRGLVGGGQIAVVAVGIHVMRRANEDRAAQMEAQRREADQREKRAAPVTVGAARGRDPDTGPQLPVSPVGGSAGGPAPKR